MDLRRNFSLNRLALLSWSASFWNRQSINFEVQRIIDDEKWSDTRKLVAIARDELKAIELPNVIYDELIHRITWLEERVLIWYRWCKSIGVPWRCTREIHWTIFGTIDEAKTVEKNFLGPDVTLSSDSEIYGVYYMACISALKDYINRNATKIIDFCQRHEKETEYKHKDILFLYRSVLTLANPESLNLSNEENTELISKYFANIGCSKEAFMFKLSVEKGYTAAAEYYWQQLDPLEIEDNLMSEAHEWIPQRLDADVFMFLLSKMSENERESFFGNIVGRLKIFNWLLILWGIIESCAWENHFFAVFNTFEGLKEHKLEYYCDLLNRITYIWKKRFTVGLDTKNPVYKQIFLAVCGKLKTSHSENNHYDSYFVRNIFEFFDIDVFKALLKKYSFRQEFLELGGTQYKHLLMGNQFGVLREIMDTALISPFEREWFKSVLMSNFDEVIRGHKFYVADNLLNWLIESNEERQRIKLKFDFLFLCAEYFANKNFTSATELITWGFSNEQEKDQYINSYVSSDLDWLHIIWSRNQNNLITSLFDFLQIFFDTKNEYVGRKISKLFTEDALRRFFIKIIDTDWTNCSSTRKAFQTLDKLMEFCLPLGDGSNLKLKISENAEKWLLHLALEHLCWGGVDVFLNWILGYEIKSFEKKKTILDFEKKREFVQRFLLSADGIQFLEKMSTSNHPKHFERYACLLVEWAGGTSVIENCMEELEASSVHDPNYKFKYASLKNMLRSFKNGDVQYDSLEHVCRLKMNSKSGCCAGRLWF